MKIAVMQPYIFPYIGYFQLINSVDKFILLDDVNFITRGWINRNKILVNDQEHLFTIPLKHSSQNKLIKDIEISWKSGWKKKFLKTIELSYSRAYRFEDTFKLVSKTLTEEENFISKLVFECLKKINRYLDIETPIVESSHVYKNSSLKGQDRIIDICKQEKADQYINPSGGIELYSKENFAQNGIELSFLKPKKNNYKQFNDYFVDSLSIIDVMMFNTKAEIRGYLNEYELI